MRVPNSYTLIGSMFTALGVILLASPASMSQSASEFFQTDNSNQSQSAQFDIPTNGSSANGGYSVATPSMNTGTYGYHDSAPYVSNVTKPTAKQTAVYLATQTTQLDKVFGGSPFLPPTRLDSFVKEAGGMAELIYGDEGDDGLPPYFEFDSSHRIERGIQSGGLTTGHKSGLPEAWGWPQ